jgi:hypothetical protein
MLVSIDKRKKIATIAIIFGLSVGVISYWTLSNFFQSLLVNSAVFFIGFGIGIFIINLYFESHKQREITYAAFLSIEPVFHSARRQVSEIIFGSYYNLGKFLAIREAYISSKGSYINLEPEDRNLIYKIVKDNYEDLAKLFDSQVKVVREAAFITIVGGNTVRDDLVNQLLYFQRYIDDFLRLDIDNESFKEQVVKMFLECVFSSHFIHSKFMQLTNRDFPDETYGWHLEELPVLTDKQ